MVVHRTLKPARNTSELDWIVSWPERLLRAHLLVGGHGKGHELQYLQESGQSEDRKLRGHGRPSMRCRDMFNVTGREYVNTI